MNDFTTKRRSEITAREWRRYDWHEITRMGDPEPVYLRGFDHEPPVLEIVIKGQQRPGGPLIPRTVL